MKIRLHKKSSMEKKDDSKKLKENVRCILCEQSIIRYYPEFNHLKIDDSHAVDICSECIRKIMQWQRGKYTLLFPTKAIKKRFQKN